MASHPSRSEERTVVEQYRRLMGTAVGIHVAVASKAEREAQIAMSTCLDWLKDVECTLTRFDARSELSRLNAAGGQWCQVSDLLFSMIEASIAAATATDGLFDPTILPVLEALGYDRDFALVQADRVSRAGAPHSLARATAGDWHGIQMDVPQRRVRLPRGTRLDFGGIAKGWAADIALDQFFTDVPDVLINMGGDIRVRGGPQTDGTHAAWPVGIGASSELTPGQLEQMPVVTLARGGLATSGASARWWYQAGERRHHLIDPRTGLPAQVWIDGVDHDDDKTTLVTVATALAPSAAHAEVAAKVAVLRGYPTALRAVEQAWSRWMDPSVPALAPAESSSYGDAPVALLLLLGSGEVVCTTNLQAYLDTVGGGGKAWLT